MKKSLWCADLGDGMMRNPILYADYSDPDVIRVKDDYYMIASSFCNAPGVPLLHSKDLVNWQVINYVWDKIPEERYNKPIHGCGAWAPAIRCHEGVFYAFIPMPDEGIYVSKTTNPYGPWEKPLNIRPGAGWIDPCPFWDDDGKAYMVAGVAKSRIGYKSVLHMVEMTPDATALIGPEVKVFDGNENDQVTIEGPKLYKRNGWYYIFAPAGGVKTGWQTVLRSRNIFGPYEYRVVMRQGDSSVNGPHQGAWVTTQTGQDFFIHFQDVYAAGRITHLQPMEWRSDDWPVIGIAKEGNDYGEPVPTLTKPDVGAAYPPCEPDASDDFKGEKLGLQWQWNANPQDGWYTFGDKGLSLNAVYAPCETAVSDLSNLLLQKWPAPEFSCIVPMDFSDLADGDMAGFVNMGMHYGALAAQKQGERCALIALIGKQHFSGTSYTTEEEKTVLLEDITGNEIFFRYDVTPVGRRDLNEREKDFPLEQVTLSYSLDGKTYQKGFSFDALPGRWVGVKMGLFARAQKENSKGRAHFQYFEFI